LLCAVRVFFSCVIVCVRACVPRVWVCESVRERVRVFEKARECERVREWESKSVRVSVKVRVRVCEWEYECECVRVCEWERVRVCGLIVKLLTTNFQAEDWYGVAMANIRALGFPGRVTRSQLVKLLSKLYPDHRWESYKLFRGRYAQQKRLEEAISLIFPVG